MSMLVVATPEVAGQRRPQIDKSASRGEAASAHLGASRRVFWVALAVAAAVTAIAATWLMVAPEGKDLSASTWIDDIGQFFAALAAGVACVWVSQRPAQERRDRNWLLLIGSGALCWAAGQAVWCVYELGRNVVVPFPGYADIGFMAAVPLMVTGILIYPVGAGTVYSRARVLLDGLTVAGSLLFISWETTLGAVFSSGGDRFTEVVGLAYPVSDVIVVAAIATVFLRARGSRRGGLVFLAAGFVALSAADSAFAYLQQTSNFNHGSLLDVGWIAGFFLIALAALRPMPLEPVQLRDTEPWISQTILPIVAMAMAMVTAAATWRAGGSLDEFMRLDWLAIIAFFVCGQTVTAIEHRRLYQSKAALADRLAESEKARTEFYRNATHEFRAPLTTIAASAHLLQVTAGSGGPHSKDLFDTLASSVRRMSSLVDDLLLLTRLEESPGPSPVSQIAVGDMAQTVARALAAAAKARHVTLVTTCEQPNCTLLGNRQQLERALVNVASNALKFTPAEGKVEMRVDHEHPWVVITVSDTGIGIPKAEQTRVFERFFRASNVDTERSEGTGLGLAITRSIIERHGGSVELKSVVGRGTSVRIQVPDSVADPEAPIG